MQPVRLSVVVITKNEEDKIVRCLESVKWADEIIIVDDKSRDRTVEICRGLGARVISHQSDYNFDRQRNLGIDQARGEWILQMDADEIVPMELKSAIQKAISEPSDYSAFKFRRKNFFLGHFMRYGGFYSGYLVKLFKRRAGHYIGHDIHETIRIQGKLGTIQADIEHYPFKSISQNIERNNLYSTARARIMLQDFGASKTSEIRANLTHRPLKSFWKMYVKRRGYRDGMYGLVFCILFSFGPMLRWMKYWELIRNKNEGNIS